MYVDMNLRTENVLGRLGENRAYIARFPLNGWRDEYGDSGNYYLMVYRADGELYPVVITEDDNYVYWEIASADVAVEGLGKVEYQYRVEDTIVKSEEYITKVLPSISGGETPAPAEGWVNQVLDAANVASESASEASESSIKAAESEVNAQASELSASRSASSASEFAESAESSKNAAASSAATATEASVNATDAARTAVEAKDTAVSAKSDAQTSAASADESERNAQTYANNAHNEANRAEAAADRIAETHYADPNNDGNIIITEVMPNGE